MLQHHCLLPINCQFDDCKARLVRFPCKMRYIRIPGFSLSFSVHLPGTGKLLTVSYSVDIKCSLYKYISLSSSRDQQTVGTSYEFFALISLLCQSLCLHEIQSSAVGNVINPSLGRSSSSLFCLSLHHIKVYRRTFHLHVYC